MVSSRRIPTHRQNNAIAQFLPALYTYTCLLSAYFTNGVLIIWNKEITKLTGLLTEGDCGDVDWIEDDPRHAFIFLKLPEHVFV